MNKQPSLLVDQLLILINMKNKRVLISLVFSFAFYILSSQTPQGFNYQAIARDGSGNPIVNTNLQVKLAVMGDSLGVTVYWEELFNPVPTNAFGLFTVIMGRGTRLATSGVAAFSNINWKVTPIFVRTLVYYQNAWKNMGSTRLWSVPYAMTANDVSGTLSKLMVAGTTQTMDEALFEVKNNTGQTIFAVYNEGVRIYVDDGIAKGTTKGGFAIGGFGTAKGISQEYFRVTRDSTRVYINQLAKTTKGGFAIGGFSPAKGNDTTGYLNLTPLNYFIGKGSGVSNTTGAYNSFFGYQNGFSNTTGSQNVFLGYKSGFSNTVGSSNVYVGYQVAYNNTSGVRNVVLGRESGVGVSGITSYYDDVFLGYRSGYSNSAGWSNVFAGTESGFTNSSGYNNVFIGYRNGYSNTSGNNNTFIGTESGYSNTYGYYNVFMGNLSGRSNTTGTQNVMIGHQAGKASQDGNYNVFIGQSAAEISVHGDGNTCVGMFAGNQMSGAGWNTFVGSYAGMWNSTGSSNAAFGNGAGYYNTASMQNTYLGVSAGAIHSVGDNNVYVGYNSGRNQYTGSTNLFLGTEAGYNSTNVNGNILIGYRAGYNETSSNRLYIENSANDKNSALIYGEFDTRNLSFNGKVGIGKTSPVAKLDMTAGNWDVFNGEGDFRIGDGTYRFKIGVSNAGGGAGDVRMTAHGGTNRLIMGGGGKDILLVTNTNVMPWTDNYSTLGGSTNRWTYVYAMNGTIQTSDIRLKTNIRDLSYGLESIMRLEPVSFTWKDEKEGKIRLGLIAQDVEKVINEVVDKGNDPSQTLGINYSELVPVLIKGIQEQQRQIESVRQENSELKSELNSLKQEIEEIKTMVGQIR
jgi:trimeric autotransporter adhesin